MRLIDALETNAQRRVSGAAEFRISLVCGFLPLHLADFLEACLNHALPDRRAVPESGLYGDLCGNLDRALSFSPHAIALALEWQDLDPRLGVRQLGGWTPDVAEDIVAGVTQILERVANAISASPYRGPIAICPPTLPLAPFSHEPAWQAGGSEQALRLQLNCFLSRLGPSRHVRIVSTADLDRVSPSADRFDIASELAVGFPYKKPHAEAIARTLARLIANPAPKKGLITDLDDTVWRGILGEVGPQGVSWDLASKTQIHGVYQQFLMALAARGVLLAIVSKNDPALVEQAFDREDLRLKKSSVFPIAAGWGRKSEAVSRVLKAWNIAADSVVFIDDSPMELEEVATNHPGIETRLFTPRDPAAVWNLIADLQNTFGKPELREEDRLRLASLRDATQFTAAAAGEGASEDSFLAQARAVLRIDTRRDSVAGRALELVNKTNQFNLNGRRITEAEWQAHLADPSAFLQAVSYEDKFGQLGIIAILAGRVEDSIPRITCWVMSCRAFARRIEYQCLRTVFEQHSSDQVFLDYQPTPRNQPVKDFLQSISEPQPDGPLTIGREAFLARSPALFHAVVIK